jgi:VanZ family protein
MPRHRSSAVPLAWLYTGLIVYASLYPFTGWRAPGHSIFAFVVAPWWHWWTWFDIISNLLGYMPFGALVFFAFVRSGMGVLRAFLLATLTGTALSFSMETLQNYLPHRVSSNVDLGLNAIGSLLGAAFGALVHRFGWVDRWQSTREQWLIPRSAGGLALLLLWPVGLLFPTAVPFGLGQVLGRLRDQLAVWLEGTAGQVWTEGWSSGGPPAPLLPAGELAIVILGLLAPCLVAFTIAMPGWRRVVLVVGAAAFGCATTTLSIALSFGPDHAFAWITPQAVQGLLVGIAAASMLSLVPRRIAAGLGLMAITALAMLVARAPADPYFASSLQGWEQGRFIRFHGAAQWVGWAWPYAALAYLLARVAARD